MKFVIALVWSFLLVTMLNYVVSSVAAVPFNFELGAILSLGFAALIFLISAIIPNDPVTHDHH